MNEYQSISASLEEDLKLSLEVILYRYDTNSESLNSSQIALIQRLNDLEATSLSIKRLIRRRQDMRSKKLHIITEGDVVGATQTNNTVSADDIENMVDNPGAPTMVHPSMSSTATPFSPLTNKDLNDFFKRPIEVDSFDIVPSSAIDVILDVWDLYTINPTVRAKLRNYAFLRADLHVRILISGSPHHYGKILVSYQPYPLRNGALVALRSSYAVDPLMRPLLTCYLSQAPGSFTMDVKKNQPGEVVCPFISTKPMNRLFNSSALALSDVTSYADFENAGSIFLWGINPVETVSATSSAVTVYVYAWMENVELAGLTGTQVVITTEGKLVTENNTGPIEYYSSKMVAISKALTYVPDITPFAQASKMLFSGISQVAAVFGWSRPAVTSSPMFVKNSWYQNGALTVAHDTVSKIVLDPEQELTVDMSFAGSTVDELAIVYLASRPSYWTTFTWATTDTPMVDNIGYIPIFPYLSKVHVTLAELYFQPTSMCYAATPFEYWNGTIEITVQIVCSQFHRGRLGFYYEPNAWQNVLIDAVVDPNKQFIHIIDLQDTQDITFSVAWNNVRPWLQNPGFSNYRFPGVTLLSISEYINGYVGIIPITSIQSPDDSDVQMNVYVRCPDLQVNGLIVTNLPTERKIITEGSLVEEPLLTTLNDSSFDGTYICDHYFGERPLSFRSLLKRYVSYAVDDSAALAGKNAVVLEESIVPPITPAYGGTGTYPTLFSYLRYAYLGMRGSIRKRYRTLMPNRDYGDHAVASLVAPSTTNTTHNVTTQSITSANIAQYMGTYLVGSAVFGLNNNAGVEVDYPYYSPNLFSFSCASDLVGTNNTDEMNSRWFRNCQVVFSSWGGSSGSTTVYISDIAAGEDFTMFRYLGAPFWSTPNT